MPVHAPDPGGGARSDEAAPDAAHAQGGVAMRVLVREPTGGSRARCACAQGIVRTVETALVAPVQRGDVLLVHAGIALARLDVEWEP